MAIDYRAERDLGSAVKFYFIVFGISLLVSIVFGGVGGILGGVLAVALRVAGVVSTNGAQLGGMIGGIFGALSQLVYIIIVSVKVLRAKNIRFTFKTVGLIASIVVLDFVPFTFGLLAFLVPAYFSTLPVCMDNLPVKSPSES